MIAMKKISFLIAVHFLSSAKSMQQPFQNIELSMPEACANQSFCEHKHDLYPIQTFRNLLNNKMMTIAKDQMTGQRQGEHTENEEICKKIQKNVIIYEIIDEHDKMRFVAQTDDNNFNKEVTISKCQYPGIISGPVPFIPEREIDTEEYTLYCEDITTEFMFLVLSHDGNSLENVKSKEIPVGCSCRYRSKLHGSDYSNSRHSWSMDY